MGSAVPLSRGQARLARIQSDRLATKTPAKSVAHQGVTARPMDQSLSKIPAQRRAELLARGTSVKRLGQEANAALSSTREEDDLSNPAMGVAERRAMREANSEEHATKRATSVTRLYTPQGDMRLQRVRPPEPPDMAI